MHLRSTSVYDSVLFSQCLCAHTHTHSKHSTHSVLTAKRINNYFPLVRNHFWEWMRPVCVCCQCEGPVPKQNHMVLFCFFHIYICSEALTSASDLLSLSFTRFCQHLLHSKIFDLPELSPSLPVPSSLSRRTVRVVPRVFWCSGSKRQRDFFFFAAFPLLTSLSTLSCQAHRLWLKKKKDQLPHVAPSHRHLGEALQR